MIVLGEGEAEAENPWLDQEDNLNNIDGDQVDQTSINCNCQ